jgi:septal ring factor EnvC (AmiA/AmiB activator)
MIITALVSADTRAVNQASLDELRQELETLEADEKRISTERRRLHNTIDYGFATPETVARSGKSRTNATDSTADRLAPRASPSKGSPGGQRRSRAAQCSEPVVGNLTRARRGRGGLRRGGRAVRV